MVFVLRMTHDALHRATVYRLQQPLPALKSKPKEKEYIECGRKQGSSTEERTL